ncbi:MAG TPA: CoB--CoM heterodisulfide reductase iron-sulfur subunit B family protein [Bryobacteraceae bacterium]|nr:CoB--CoM heterodisulfide reductase iron-sulfur subunit B family protein [Bryobacteraceae bacterium]
MDVGYYPGCALHGSSNDYEASVRACLGALGVGLKEIDDWICCGATAAHSINHELSVALPARNLALAEKQGFQHVLAPCPMCSMELLKARQAMNTDAEVCRRMQEIVELPVLGSTQVLNLIQVLQDVGLDRIKAAVKRPLQDLTAACYYGCLLTRPPGTVKFDDPEHPHSMEAVVEALGAKTVEWNYKTECCGAGLTMANEDTVLDLSNKILSGARAKGANCLVVACPMCHVNLDMKQGDIERRYSVRHGMVVYYLSDLVGLAMGLTPQELGIDRHFVWKG